MDNKKLNKRMNISVFIVNHVQVNCYLLWNGKGSDAIIVDPGMCDAREREAVNRFIADNELRLKSVLLTHQHFDHILSASYMASEYGVEVCASVADNLLGEHLPQQVAQFGLPYRCEPLTVTHNLKHGDMLELNGENIEVIGVPGHSPGGLAFYLAESGCVFTGDSLFRRSIGRTDLPGGNEALLIDSVRKRLLTLPPDTVAYCGHGDATEIGEERRTNPYLFR